LQDPHALFWFLFNMARACSCSHLIVVSTTSTAIICSLASIFGLPSSSHGHLLSALTPSLRIWIVHCIFIWQVQEVAFIHVHACTTSGRHPPTVLHCFPIPYRSSAIRAYVMRPETCKYHRFRCIFIHSQWFLFEKRIGVVIWVIQ